MYVGAWSLASHPFLASGPGGGLFGTMMVTACSRCLVMILHKSYWAFIIGVYTGTYIAIASWSVYKLQ